MLGFLDTAKNSFAIELTILNVLCINITPNDSNSLQFIRENKRSQLILVRNLATALE